MTLGVFRHTARGAFVLALIVLLAIPASVFGAASDVIAPSENRSSEFSASATLPPTYEKQSSLRFESSMEYAFPDAPPPRTEDECRPIPRLCSWLRGHDSLIETPDEPVGGGVSWQSGSYSAFQSAAKSAPATLDVPSLSISARVDGVGINEQREMEVPDRRNTVGWYRYGPAPGAEGSAVIAGHLDDNSGRSVFFNLRHIEIGAAVIVTTDDGRDVAFEVVDKVSYEATKIPSAALFSREGEPRLALITCGGSWDAAAGRYTETVVIYAELITNQGS